MTPDGVVRNGVIECEGQYIVSITAGSGPGSGHTVLPGFVDLQVNGSGDVDVATASRADLQRLDRLLVAQGTTAWCPTLVSMPFSRYASCLDKLDDLQSADSTVARVLGAHLEGPFLGTPVGAHRRESIVAIDQGWIDSLPPIVRMMTIAPEQPGALAAIASMVARGWLVSLGHSAATHAEAVAAADAGARLVTHLFNAMPSAHHREPGLVGAALSDDRLAASIIPDLVHVHPAMLRAAFRAKGRRRIVVVTDAIGHRNHRLADRDIVFDGAAPRLADGTLAGSALTMPQAVANLVEDVGISLVDVVHATSTTPSHRIGETDRGRIEPRCRADFVVLDDSFEVVQTIVGGRVVFER